MPVGRYLTASALAAAVLRHDRGPGPVQRCDRIAWRVDASRKIVHPNGMVDVPGVATRVGVLLYDDVDQQGQPITVRELRPASEVMRAESLATLVGAPVTIEHPGAGPDDDQGLAEVTAQNARALTHGWVLSVEPEESTGLVWVWVRLASEDVLAACASGKTELSCGYTAVLVDPFDPANAALVALWGPEPGLAANGERYDKGQTEIQYNHLAIVDEARAGHVARLHLDSRTTMKRTIKIDGKTHQVVAFLADSIKALALDAAAVTKAKADAIEVGPVSIDGTDMILPRTTIEGIIEFIGGNSAGPSSPEPMVPDAAPDPLKDPAMLGDASEKDPPKDEKKADAQIQARVDRAVDLALAKALPGAAAKIADAVTSASRERAAIDRQALPVLGPRYDYAAVDEHGIALAVLKADSSPRLAQAETLAIAARKGDSRAAGRLAQLMDDVLDRRRDQADTSADLGAAMFRAADQSRTDSAEDETPAREKLAAKRRADATKTASTAA